MERKAAHGSPPPAKLTITALIATHANTNAGVCTGFVGCHTHTQTHTRTDTDAQRWCTFCCAADVPRLSRGTARPCRCCPPKQKKRSDPAWELAELCTLYYSSLCFSPFYALGPFPFFHVRCTPRRTPAHAESSHGARKRFSGARAPAHGHAHTCARRISPSPPPSPSLTGAVTASVLHKRTAAFGANDVAVTRHTHTHTG